MPRLTRLPPVLSCSMVLRTGIHLPSPPGLPHGDNSDDNTSNNNATNAMVGTRKRLSSIGYDSVKTSNDNRTGGICLHRTTRTQPRRQPQQQPQQQQQQQDYLSFCHQFYTPAQSPSSSSSSSSSSQTAVPVDSVWRQSIIQLHGPSIQERRGQKRHLPESNTGGHDGDDSDQNHNHQNTIPSGTLDENDLVWGVQSHEPFVAPSESKGQPAHYTAEDEAPMLQYLQEHHSGDVAIASFALRVQLSCGRGECTRVLDSFSLHYTLSLCPTRDFVSLNAPLSLSHTHTHTHTHTPQSRLCSSLFL